MPGDSNQDGQIDLSDGIRLLLYLYASPGPLPCEGDDIQSGGNRLLLDIDSSSRVDITDAIYLLSYLFLDGSAPRLGTTCVPIPGCPDQCSY